MMNRIITDISDYIFVSDKPTKADVIFLPGGTILLSLSMLPSSITKAMQNICSHQEESVLNTTNGPA